MRTDNNTLNDVRSEMMATLRALRDRENPMDLDRAKTMATIANVLVDTAKVEVDYLKVTGQNFSGFLNEPELQHLSGHKPAGDGGALTNGITSIVRHRMVG